MRISLMEGLFHLVSTHVQEIVPLPGQSYDAYETKDHLVWMLDQIENSSVSQMPMDKEARWLGSICGILEVKYDLPKAVVNEFYRELGDTAAVEASHPIMSASVEIAEGLIEKHDGIDTAETPSIAKAAEEVIEQLKNPHQHGINRYSFAIGRLQGLLKGAGFLDFTEERNRTRPIMHKAYAAVGFGIPKTRERTS